MTAKHFRDRANSADQTTLAQMKQQNNFHISVGTDGSVIVTPLGQQSDGLRHQTVSDEQGRPCVIFYVPSENGQTNLVTITPTPNSLLCIGNMTIGEGSGNSGNVHIMSLEEIALRDAQFRQQPDGNTVIQSRSPE